MFSALASRLRKAVVTGRVPSVDRARVFKPDPRAYALVEQTLGLPPADVMFVSSNGFDVAGAKAFGFHVARIERVPVAALRKEIAAVADIGPLTMFKVLRLQADKLGQVADDTISALAELPALVTTRRS